MTLLEQRSVTATCFRGGFVLGFACMSLPKTKRNTQIVRMRDRGFSFGLIGESFGIDKKTAYDIYIQEKRRAKKDPKRGFARIRKKRAKKVIPR